MKNYAYVFLRFFEKPKNMTFYVFFQLLHTFCRTLQTEPEQEDRETDRQTPPNALSGHIHS